MHRFFIPTEWLHGEEVRLEGAQAYQISRVLRFRKGDPLILLDNSGWEYLVEISAVSDGCVLARLTERRPAPPEPRLSVTIYQGLLKGKKFDWTLQKGTEIGVAAFVPIACERCVALPAEDRSGQRWGHIIQEAAEQCGRGRLPNLGPPRTFRDACDEAARPSFLLWERPGAASLREMLHKASWEQTGQVGLFVGPEGGFSREEVSYAEGRGLRPVSLGQRILRGETAGIVAAAILLYEIGDLG